jgi:hypothetical protein
MANRCTEGDVKDRAKLSFQVEQLRGCGYHKQGALCREKDEIFHWASSLMLGTRVTGLRRLAAVPEQEAMGADTSRM